MRSERGSALVETALILPVLVLLTAAVVDFGTAWQKRAATEESARVAAVTGFATGDAPNHDEKVVQALWRDLYGRNVSGLEWIVIFDGDRYGSVPPVCTTRSAIKAGGVNGVCTAYSPAAIASIVDGTAVFDDTCADNPDRRWCSPRRSVPGGWTVGISYSIRQDATTRVLPFFQRYTIHQTVVITEHPRNG
ncbi:MAG: TadE/TadG family type IV pilus assembly protein [Acidimicrobiales bacterium]